MEAPLAMFTADIDKVTRDGEFRKYDIYLRSKQADGCNTIVAMTWGKRYEVHPMTDRSQVCVYDSEDVLVAAYFVQSIEEKELCIVGHTISIH
jgi:hypothetical protein